MADVVQNSWRDTIWLTWYNTPDVIQNGWRGTWLTWYKILFMFVSICIADPFLFLAETVEEQILQYEKYNGQFESRRSTDSRLLFRQRQLPLQNVKNQAKPKSATGGRHFRHPSSRGSLWNQFTNSCARDVWFTDFEKTHKLKPRKRGLSSQNSAKLASLDMGHPPEVFI